MTVVSTHKDAENLTLTFVAEFAAPAERVWRVWEDPRQLERWWGPPTWPATFERHDFEVKGESRYYMTGPDGDRAHGWLAFTAIDAPRELEFDDGFAGADGEPLDRDDTTHLVVTLEDTGGTTRMTTVSTFRSTEQLDRMSALGMEEGMRLAMAQIDTVLAESA
jgi:uncharacterized protein YndB with AHSA1/START domain